MARPRKTGLDYFPFDVDFFNDEKIVAIAGEFGLKGEITVVKLLCAVYRNGYFIVWSDMLKMKMLHSLPGVSAELLDQIVNRLVKWGFFDKPLFDSVRVLTSRGIQRRFFNSTKRRLDYDDLPYKIIDEEETHKACKEKLMHTETRVSAYKNPADEKFLRAETPQSKVNNRKNTSTGVEVQKRPTSASTSYALTLDEEIELLKAETGWLDQLQVLYHMDIAALQARLDEFRLHCAADGKNAHESLSDAKRHFNSWMRIVASKPKEQHAENRTQRKNRRAGNLLRTDEEKTYGGSF
jgi:hypothetical protein